MEKHFCKIVIALFLFASCNNAKEGSIANRDSTIVGPLMQGTKEAPRMVHITA
jgi:hypothetical protein